MEPGSPHCRQSLYKSEPAERPKNDVPLPQTYAVPIYSKTAQSLEYQVSPKLTSEKCWKKLKTSTGCLGPLVWWTTFPSVIRSVLCIPTKYPKDPRVCVSLKAYVYEVKRKSLSRVRLFHGLYSPWNSAGQNIGVGSISFLQEIFPTQVSHIAGGFFTIWDTREALTT